MVELKELYDMVDNHPNGVNTPGSYRSLKLAPVTITVSKFGTRTAKIVSNETGETLFKATGQEIITLTEGEWQNELQQIMSEQNNNVPQEQKAEYSTPKLEQLEAPKGQGNAPQPESKLIVGESRDPESSSLTPTQSQGNIDVGYVSPSLTHNPADGETLTPKVELIEPNPDMKVSAAGDENPPVAQLVDNGVLSPAMSVEVVQGMTPEVAAAVMAPHTQEAFKDEAVVQAIHADEDGSGNAQ